MPTSDQITASLFVWWDDNVPSGITTIHPAQQTETVSLTEWIELRISAFSRRPGRAGGPAVIDLAVIAHCFVKPQADASRIDELADAVAETLAGRTIPVLDHSQSDTPVVGYLGLQESETHHLTRNHENHEQLPLQHAVVSTPGIVQAL